VLVETEPVGHRGRLPAIDHSQFGQDPRDVDAGRLGSVGQHLADPPLVRPSATSASTSPLASGQTRVAGDAATGARQSCLPVLRGQRRPRWVSSSISWLSGRAQSAIVVWWAARSMVSAWWRDAPSENSASGLPEPAIVQAMGAMGIGGRLAIEAGLSQRGVGRPFPSSTWNTFGLSASFAS